MNLQDFESVAVVFRYRSHNQVPPGEAVETTRNAHVRATTLTLPERKIILEPTRMRVQDFPGQLMGNRHSLVSLRSQDDGQLFSSRFLFLSPAVTRGRIDRYRLTRHLDAYDWLTRSHTWLVSAKATNSRLWVTCKKPQAIPVRAPTSQRETTAASL